MTAQQSGRYHALDAFRGLLAIAVAMGHYSDWTQHHTISGAFVLAVDFFFCLSGFVLTKSIVRYRGDDRDWLPEFSVRRFLRIWPTYLLILFVTIGFVFPILRHDPMNLDAYVVGNVIMLGQSVGFGIPSPILTDTAPSIAWSASVEFWIGLPFFFVIFLLRRRMDIAVVLSSVLGGFLIIYMWKFSPNYLAAGWQLAFSVIPFTVLRGVIGFSFGVIAYYVVETWRPRGGSILEISIFAVVLTLFHSSSFNRFNEFLVPVISAAAVVIFSAQGGIVSKALSAKPFQIMGDASYPVYLIHPIVLDIWRRNFQYDAISIICYLIFTILTGYLIHLVLERPFINIGRKYKASKGPIDRESFQC